MKGGPQRFYGILPLRTCEKYSDSILYIKVKKNNSLVHCIKHIIIYKHRIYNKKKTLLYNIKIYDKIAENILPIEKHKIKQHKMQTKQEISTKSNLQMDFFFRTTVTNELSGRKIIL